MADYGGKVGVKVTLQNHWGLTANPINIRIIIEEVNTVSGEWPGSTPDGYIPNRAVILNGMKG